MVVGYAIIGIVLERVLQSLRGVSGLSFAKLNLSAVNEGVVVTGVVGEDRIGEPACLVQAVFQDEQLNVVLLDLVVFRMVMKHCRVFGDGFVEIAGGEIKVAQHTVADGVVEKLVLDLLEERFRVGLLPLRYIKTSERGRRGGVLGIKIQGMAQFLFALGKAAA